MKDKKENFRRLELERKPCRLINPAKPEVGKISKRKLDLINKETRRKSGLNQWQSTDQMLDWYNGTEKKNEKRFIKFDVVSFYPTISKEALSESLNWARQIGVEISPIDERTILASRRNFLWHKNQPWKKKTNPEFDCTMGSFDGAEVCDIVGLYILHVLTSSNLGVQKEELGLYRDDGLGIMRRSKRELDNIRKGFHRLLSPLGFQITMETGMKSTDFLDVTLHLESGTYEPFRKEDTIPVYINKRSNHPKAITKNLPGMIEKRLNSRCSNEGLFNKHKATYEKSLAQSGYKTKLKYNQDTTNQQKKRKPRFKDTFWFNPPYNLKVKSRVEKIFLSLLDKNFPRGTTWYKFFNRHTVRVSYSCTRNIAGHIGRHNIKVTKGEELVEPGCNCTADPCPVDGKCLTKGLVYTETIRTRKENYTYNGSTGLTFKERYGGDKFDLKHETSTGTALSNKFWQLKKENPDETPIVKWNIVNKCHPLKAGMSTCDVCLTEKTRILLQHEGPEPKPPKNTIFLNQRTEVYSKCRHRRKYILKLCDKLYEKEMRGQTTPPS